MAKKSQKLGPRATVVFASGVPTTGKGKKTTTLYSYMRKSTAEFFGFKIADKAVTQSKNGSKTITRSVRGSSGAGSIKVPVGSGTKANRPEGKDGKVVYKQIPVPANATIRQIQKFLQGATKNKPDRFVSVHGRTYPVPTEKIK